MKKKDYQTPTILVVKLQRQAQLLTGSNGLNSPLPFENDGNPIG